MRIVVCIKQVPDTTEVRMDPVKGTLIREGVVSIVNPFDSYAVEEGVRLKEKHGGTCTVVTMGPPQAEQALRDCISVGADEAYLVSDRAFAGSDTWATSLTLAAAIRKIGFDLIICGKQAIDGDTAQVGPGIAVHLDLPQATYARKIREVGEKSMIIERLLEEGVETMEMPLPGLITVVKEINEPRLPSLKGKMRAKKYELKKLTAADLDLQPGKLGLDGSPTRVMKIFAPPPRAGGEVFKGEADQCADKLVAVLAKNGVV
ncbi:MAG TPA: electron transfer flavoprotein subunit beta/FixA family protein [Planctomycetota bacterium]|nr:electron transfer flavoprotein subunit beta/FixA family protein [Planctomycetota bacterium]